MQQNIESTINDNERYVTTRQTSAVKVHQHGGIFASRP